MPRLVGKGGVGRYHVDRAAPFGSHRHCAVGGLLGGSTNPRPGEVSIARNGVLFL